MKLLSETLAFSLDQTEIPPAFQPLARLPLLIMVGLTGVGKSTVIELLGREVAFKLLPNRRFLTDELMITALQLEAGETPQPVTDRLKRFDYTARYRAKYPGGMAHALSQLWVKPGRVDGLFLFDGLRGVNEVEHGSRYFPQARFIVLEAPDLVRLGRLLNRGDAFDRVQGQAVGNGDMMAALTSVPEIEAVFTSPQLAQIAGAVAADHTPAEVVKKISIIVEERRNYDPKATREYLIGVLPPRQLLVVDTTVFPPEGVVDQIKRWL